MLLKEKLLNIITEIPDVSNNLFQYNGKPAVFYQKLPYDEDIDWNKNFTFPRIVFDFSLKSSKKIKVLGDISIQIFYSNDNSNINNDILNSIKNNLYMTFLEDEGNLYYINWKSIKSINIINSNLICICLSFNIYELIDNSKVTFSPVYFLNKLIKDKFEYFKVIGIDKFENKWNPTKSEPAIYVECKEEKSIKTNYCSSLQESVLHIHILSPDIEQRINKSENIFCYLSIEKEVSLENNSPYIITDIKRNVKNSLFHKGQIILRGQYSTVRKEEECALLNNGNFNIN